MLRNRFGSIEKFFYIKVLYFQNFLKVQGKKFVASLTINRYETLSLWKWDTCSILLQVEHFTKMTAKCERLSMIFLHSIMKTWSPFNKASFGTFHIKIKLVNYILVMYCTARIFDQFECKRYQEMKRGFIKWAASFHKVFQKCFALPECQTVKNSVITYVWSGMKYVRSFFGWICSTRATKTI